MLHIDEHVIRSVDELLDVATKRAPREQHRRPEEEGVLGELKRRNGI